MIIPRMLKPPPRRLTAEGRPRRLGIELEFAAVSAHDGAEIVHSLYGGRIEKDDPHRFYILGTSLGDFTCELDTQYAHRSSGEPPPAEETEDTLTLLLNGFQRELRALFGDVSSLVMPCEVVCPPIEIGELPRLDALVKALREAGAAGTRESPFYAFGAQLNPELADGGHDWVLRVFKAYLLMSDWLRAVMSIHLTRQLVDFANPFPRRYVRKVLDPDYWPDADGFMGDYLAYNPTRNLELDLLPLLCWQDEKRVRAAVRDPRVKGRPTFHYRLPDANIGQAGWSLILEWNRWCVVETLAERRDVLDEMSAAWRHNEARFLQDDWAVRASEWVLVT
ncbi:MAG: amidoligase family protein [Alphaproteobacteria bacterium]